MKKVPLITRTIFTWDKVWHKEINEKKDKKTKKDKRYYIHKTLFYFKWTERLVTQ